MKTTPEQATCTEARARVLAEAAKLIDEAFVWSETTEAPTLTQIETLVLELRRHFGQVLAESLIATQAAAVPVDLPPCPRCGQPMQPKGAKAKTVVSQVGDLALERAHFYCPSCERGLFPPRRPTRRRRPTL